MREEQGEDAAHPVPGGLVEASGKRIGGARFAELGQKGLWVVWHGREITTPGNPFAVPFAGPTIALG